MPVSTQNEGIWVSALSINVAITRVNAHASGSPTDARHYIDGTNDADAFSAVAYVFVRMYLPRFGGRDGQKGHGRKQQSTQFWC